MESINIIRLKYNNTENTYHFLKSVNYVESIDDIVCIWKKITVTLNERILMEYINCIYANQISKKKQDIRERKA